jgi:hypothetical protein
MSTKTATTQSRMDVIPSTLKLVLETYNVKDALLDTSLLADIDVVHGYRCEECEEFSTDTADSPLYECGSCGTVFARDTSADGSSNRCPDCNKFGSKTADFACIECQEGEAVPTLYVVCPLCEESVGLDDIATHLTDGCR